MMKEMSIQEMKEKKNTLMEVVEELKRALKQGFTILGASDYLLLLDGGVKFCELFTEESFLEEQKSNWENWKDDEALQGVTFNEFMEHYVWTGEYYSDIEALIEVCEANIEELDDLLCD